MKSFLHAMTTALEAVWLHMKTINVYAGAIPSGVERIEHRTAEEWRRRPR